MTCGHSGHEQGARKEKEMINESIVVTLSVSASSISVFFLSMIQGDDSVRCDLDPPQRSALSERVLYCTHKRGICTMAKICTAHEKLGV